MGSLIAHNNTLIINIDILNGQTITCFLEEEEIEFFCKENNISNSWIEDYKNSNGFVDEAIGPDGKYIVLGLNSKSDRVIVHESVHACHKIMSFRGIPINNENTEIQAYLIDYIFQEIKDHVSSKKRGI
jgi:hypothetical protein